MKPMRLIPLFLLLLASTAFGADDNLPVRKAVQDFYAVYLRVHPSGVPAKAERTAFRAVVSPGLFDLLEKAAAAEGNYSRETKGEVPPLVEGDLFTSLFEGATSFSVLSCSTRQKGAACLVELTYADSAAEKPFAWKDRIMLVKGRQRWAVDDIEYMGDWQFMLKGRLREVLEQVIAEGNGSGAGR
jgi:hypothetical protein